MAAVDKIAPVIDLTLALDPAEFYGADLAGCPTWPVSLGINPDPVVSRPGDAEARLEQIRAYLNRVGAPLREPTKRERAELRERYFTAPVEQSFEDSDEVAWRNRHGMAGLRPRDRTNTARLNLIVEAAHIRGFIAKSVEDQRRAAEAKAAGDRDRAERSLARASEDHARYLAEFDGLKEGAARHQQRLDDERAFARANEIKNNVLPSLETGARQAANTLGIEPPTLPGVAT